MEKLLEILNELLSTIGIDPVDKLEPHTNLRSDLEIDSISYAELIVRLEDEFGIDVNENGRADTVGDLITRLIK